MPYKKLFYFLNLYKWTFIIGTFFVVLANVASSYTIKQVEGFIDLLVNEIGKKKSPNFDIQGEVLQFLFYYIGLTLLSAVFTFLMRQTIIVASRKIEQKLKGDLYAHIQRLAITHFKNYPIGDYMSRMAEDVGKIRELFGPAVMYLVNMFTTLSVSIFFMWQISGELTLYALLPLPFLSFFIYFFNIYSLQFNKKLQEEMSAMTSVAQESYNGIRIIIIAIIIIIIIVVGARADLQLFWVFLFFRSCPQALAASPCRATPCNTAWRAQCFSNVMALCG